VRELRNAIDRMVILYDGPVLRAAWWNRPATDAQRGRTRRGGSPGRAAARGLEWRLDAD